MSGEAGGETPVLAPLGRRALIGVGAMARMAGTLPVPALGKQVDTPVRRAGQKGDGGAQADPRLRQGDAANEAPGPT